MNFVFFQTHISTPFAQDIDMACYLLTWTCFNDVNGHRNILIKSQLTGILFMKATRQNETKLRQTEKT